MRQDTGQMMDRRAIIKRGALGAAAAAMATAPAVAKASGQDPVLPLCAAWWQCHRDVNEITSRGRDLTDIAEIRASEDELSDALDRRYAAMERITQTPPITPAGLAAVLAIAVEESDVDRWSEDRPDPHERLFVAAARSPAVAAMKADAA